MSSIFANKAKVQAVIVFGFPFAALFTVLLTHMTRAADADTPQFWIGIGGMLFGYALLVCAKWDQIRRGDFFSWGLSTKNPLMKTLYILSYCSMAIGFFLAAFSGSL